MGHISPTAAGSTATRNTNERFVELLCADEDLLRAEFDAIIAAEWPSPPGPPPAEPDRDADPHPRPRRAKHRRDAIVAARSTQPRHPGIGGWARPRSPPRSARQHLTTAAST